jgi:hypothetical protein
MGSGSPAISIVSVVAVFIPSSGFEVLGGGGIVDAYPEGHFEMRKTALLHNSWGYLAR